HAEDAIRDRNVTGGQTCALPSLIAAAGALARADRALDAADVLPAHQPARAGADGLETVDDRHVLLLPGGEGDPARHDRARIDERSEERRVGQDGEERRGTEQMTT